MNGPGSLLAAKANRSFGLLYSKCETASLDSCVRLPGQQGRPTRLNSTALPESRDGLPWAVNSYYTKKLSRDTDELGNIIAYPESISEPYSWNDRTKLYLAIQVVARDTGMPVDELSQRVSSLLAVLPDTDTNLASMKQADMVQSLLAGAPEPCALLNVAPMLLDPELLSGVLAEAQRLFGGKAQPLMLLQHNPGLAASCQSLQKQARGDRDVE